MDGGPSPDRVQFGCAELSRLMPMHLWIDSAGVIRAAGPTLARLWPAPLPGLGFLDVFDLRKPAGICAASDLIALAGHRILLAPRDGRGRPLRGLAVGAGEGRGLFLNLSFGLAVAEAVRDHGLSQADFAPTDLTVELLYLAEVKRAVLGELAALNARLAAARSRAEAQAMTDPLTGLANRRGFDSAFAQMRAKADRGGSFALLHIDLDRFKAINDTLGHAAGDDVLARVAGCLRAEVRAQDVVARTGGDEFVALVEGARDIAALHQLGARIVARIEAIAPAAGVARLSASIGAILAEGAPLPPAEALLAAADDALYAAKRAGRGRCVVAPLPPA